MQHLNEYRLGLRKARSILTKMVRIERKQGTGLVWRRRPGVVRSIPARGRPRIPAGFRCPRQCTHSHRRGATSSLGENLSEAAQGLQRRRWRRHPLGRLARGWMASVWAVNPQHRSPSPSTCRHWVTGPRVLSHPPASIPRPVTVYGARPAPTSPTAAASPRELGAPGGGSYFRGVMLLWEGSRDRLPAAPGEQPPFAAPPRQRPAGRPRTLHRAKATTF